MIMKNIILSLLALICASAYAQGQKVSEYDYDVEGIRIGQCVDYEKFASIFGKPDKYERKVTNGGVYDIIEAYTVGNNYFEFGDGGHFCSFTLEDNRFSALTLFIENGIKVGDKLSELDNFRYGKPIVAEWMKPFSQYIIYVLFPDQDCKILLCVKDGIIKKIIYSDPI